MGAEWEKSMRATDSEPRSTHYSVSGGKFTKYFFYLQDFSGKNDFSDLAEISDATDCYFVTCYFPGVFYGFNVCINKC